MVTQMGVAYSPKMHAHTHTHAHNDIQVEGLCNISADSNVTLKVEIWPVTEKKTGTIRADSLINLHHYVLL